MADLHEATAEAKFADEMIAENGRWLSEPCPGCKLVHEQVEARFDCEIVNGKPQWHLATRGVGCNWVRTSPYMSFEDAALSLEAAGYELDRPFDAESSWKPVLATLRDIAA